MLFGLDIGQYLHVHMYWARHHRWARGTKWDFPPLPCHVMWLMQRGAVDVILEGKLFHIRAGDAWLYPYVQNRFIVVKEDAEWLTLGFEAILHDDIDAIAPLVYSQWRPADTQPVTEWVRALVCAERGNTWEEHLIGDSLTRAIVAWLWKERGGGLQQLAQAQLSPWLRDVLQSMRSNPQKCIHEYIASSGYSPAQFRRNFRDVLGCSPHEYLTRIRMERAKYSLETTVLSIAMISSDAGFASAEHFTRQFKKVCGMPPSRYRQMANQLKI